MPAVGPGLLRGPPLDLAHGNEDAERGAGLWLPSLPYRGLINMLGTVRREQQGMADREQVETLLQGGSAWNAWREAHPAIRPDLVGADLQEANLGRADLHEANLHKADLVGAYLFKANLHGADLSGADLFKANLHEADLHDADLHGARLVEADLRMADLHGARLVGADLREANFREANLIEADLTDANLTGCRIYGVSAWRLKLTQGTKQQDLVITRNGEPDVTVDNIEVAQFVYLLLHNEKIRDVIDTVGRKGVLLLGRFTEGRIAVLDRLRDELRERGFVPMVFNFDKPETKDFTETVRLLAGLSQFVIVDITNPRSAPLELQATVPECMVPFVPILERGEEPFAMLRDLLNKHDWVLDPIRYSSVQRLAEVLDLEIIEPAKTRFAELLARKAEKMRVKDI
jgi:Pentapeptide repeats (8 copies)